MLLGEFLFAFFFTSVDVKGFAVSTLLLVL